MTVNCAPADRVPLTVAGAVSTGGKAAETVMLACAELPLAEAVTVAVCWLAAPTAFAGNVADVWLAATCTEAGTVSTELFELIATAYDPVGAAVRLTLQVADAPAATAAGWQVRLDTLGAALMESEK